MTQSVFKCPYCQFDIPSAATVCGYCTKELTIFKPFISFMDANDAELSKLRAELAEIRVLVENTTTTVHVVNAESSLAENLADLTEPTQKITETKAVIVFLLSLLLCVGVLDFLHWILLFIYDTNLVALRIITVVLPMLVGLLLFRKIQIHWSISFTGALALGALSVLGMLAITSFIDGVPFLPESVRDWREVGEYVFAIACSLITGFFIENWRETHQLNIRKKISLSLLIERDETGKFKAPEWTQKIESLFTAAAPFISATTAIVSGVRVFIG